MTFGLMISMVKAVHDLAQPPPPSQNGQKHAEGPEQVSTERMQRRSATARSLSLAWAL